MVSTISISIMLMLSRVGALLEEDCLQVKLQLQKKSPNLSRHVVESHSSQGDAGTNSVPMIGRRGERRHSSDDSLRDPTFSGEDQKRGNHNHQKHRSQKGLIIKCFLGLPYPPPPSINADWNWQKRGKRNFLKRYESAAQMRIGIGTLSAPLAGGS